MAFTGNHVCTSFKVDLLAARHNFSSSGGNSFKMSLYTSSATLDATTTAYTATNEHTPTGSAYTTTGKVLVQETSPTHPRVPSGVTAVADFQDVTWSASTITARGALIYNDTATTPVADCSVVVLDFLADKSSSAGDFVVSFPVADISNAIIRIA
jgi:hypothetical protein